MAIEIEVPMRAVQVRLMCECGKGEYLYVHLKNRVLCGSGDNVNEPLVEWSETRYEHHCFCGNEFNAERIYPYIKYVEDVR